jgi:hypothetical protein
MIVPERVKRQAKMKKLEDPEASKAVSVAA